MMLLRRRSLLLTLVIFACGGGLASAGWDNLKASGVVSLWDVIDGREVLQAADVARMARDGHPLGSDDGWAIRRVLVRVDRAVMGPDNHIHAVQVEDDVEVSFRIPARFSATPGTTLVVWACLRDWTDRRLTLGQVCPE